MKHMYSYSFFSGQRKAQIYHHVTSTALHSSACVCVCVCVCARARTCMRAVEDTARRDIMLSEETHSLSGNRHGLDYNKSFSVHGLGSED